MIAIGRLLGSTHVPICAGAGRAATGRADRYVRQAQQPNGLHHREPEHRTNRSVRCAVESVGVRHSHDAIEWRDEN